MVNKELILNVTQDEIQIALLEDKVLVEFSKDKIKSEFSVGDIYLGKVKKVMPGLNAAFVSIGSDKDAFVHYLDLGHNFQTFQRLVKTVNAKKQQVDFPNFLLEPSLKRDGKMPQVVSAGDLIMVQIAKEAIGTKGPRLTSEISIAGRNVVLLPFSDKISISQKIRSKEERLRLKNAANASLKNNYGVIIRTAASSRPSADLENEISILIRKWESTVKKLSSLSAPSLLVSEMSRTIAILRDLLTGEFSNIYVDNESSYDDIREYISSIAPEKEKIVKLYKGTVPIFDNFDVTKQIKSAFGKIVSIKKGAYLIVEHTEALHVIDVNSGIRGRADNQEESAMEVNLNAISEIARILRLRDMGGIVVIDFIDLHKAENRKTIFDKMREAMSGDRAKHNILPLTKFGLMQITRQRVRPETHVEITEMCPSCQGTGKISPAILIDRQIEANLSYFIKEKGYSVITLRLNPIIAAYLKKGFPSIRQKWMMKYKCIVKVIPDSNISFVDHKFFNSSGDELI